MLYHPTVRDKDQNMHHNPKGMIKHANEKTFASVKIKLNQLKIYDQHNELKNEQDCLTRTP